MKLKKNSYIKHILQEYLGNEFKEGSEEIVDTFKKKT